MTTGLRPNLFIIGAAKCGTTSLAQWLSRHPEVYLIYGKESNFWRRDYYRGWGWYERKHLKNYAGEKYILDASVVNNILPFNASRVKAECDDVKIIQCLRNPFDRMYSHWAMLNSWRIGRVAGYSETIAENIDLIKRYGKTPFKSEAHYACSLEPKGEPYRPAFIEQSLYANNVNNWLDVGDVYFSDLADINIERHNILEWLCLDPDPLLKFKYPKANVSNNSCGSKHLPDHTVNELSEIFYCEAEQLDKIINSDKKFTDIWFGGQNEAG